MKRLIAEILLAACGARGHDATPEAPAPAPAARDDDRPARCAAFARLEAECAYTASYVTPLSEDEKASVRDVAYAVCTGTSRDADAIRYYGDIDRRLACVAGKSICDEVSDCLQPDDR